MKRKQQIYVIGSLALLGTLATVYFTTKMKKKEFDARTERELASLEPHVESAARLFLTAARKLGIDLRITSGRRDCAHQNRLYAQGRTTPGNIVTKAKCGQSAHNYGLAIDVVEFVDSQPVWETPNWEKIGQLGEQYGFTWGGRWTRFVDRPHFEMLGGNTINSLYEKYQQTGVLKA